MLTVAEIVERVEKVDMMGLLKVSSDNDNSIALVELWRIGGAFQNDREKKITMIIDPDPGHLEDELFFYVPQLETCKPGEFALTVYMDANKNVNHGSHRWQPGEEGSVFFSYAMPIPPGMTDFPDTALFGRLIKDMYEGIFFRELKGMELRIKDDPMLSPEEKQAKCDQALDMYKRLTGPRETDGDGV